MNKTAHILLAHGSRDSNWRASLEAIAARLHTADQPTCCAYVELSSPDVFEAVQELVAQGCSSIVITPMFLGLGQHARGDIPALTAQLQLTHPSTHIELRPALCDMPNFVDTLAQLITLSPSRA